MAQQLHSRESATLTSAETLCITLNDKRANIKLTDKGKANSKSSPRNFVS
jgi:hypothetical protein